MCAAQWAHRPKSRAAGVARDQMGATGVGGPQQDQGLSCSQHPAGYGVGSPERNFFATVAGCRGAASSNKMPSRTIMARPAA